MFPNDFGHKSIERAARRDDQIHQVQARTIGQDGTLDGVGLAADPPRPVEQFFLFARRRARTGAGGT